MTDIASEPIKKTSRTKKAVVSPDSPTGTNLEKETIFLITNLELQINRLTELKNDVEKLERTIGQTKQEWSKEQKAHEQELIQKDQADEITRRRDQETYDYETKLSRKRSEDELIDKKIKLEKELADRHEEIEQDKRRLAELQKLVDGFPAEKDKEIKEAVFATQKKLNDQFETDKKLREQEIKGEKEIFSLKISSFETENARQTKEVETLRKALEQATTQIKDIAVKVIESGSHSENQPAAPHQ